MEGVSTAWSIEIQDPPEPLDQPVDSQQGGNADAAEDGSSAVTIFEQTIKDPKRETRMSHPSSDANGSKVEVETSDMQSFLTKQLEVLEQLKAEDEKDRANKPSPQLEMSPIDDQGRVNEHIGPVQFNMGGIQVDADDMLKKLRVSTLCQWRSTCILLTQLFRTAKPVDRRERRACLLTQATSRHTTRRSRTSSPASSRSLLAVPVAVPLPKTTRQACVFFLFWAVF